MRPKYMYYLSSPQVGSEALKRNKGSFAVAFIHVLVRTKAHTHTYATYVTCTPGIDYLYTLL